MGIAFFNPGSAASNPDLDFGQLYTSGGSGTQVPNTAFTNITQWASAGLNSANITPDAANNKITIGATGIYHIAFQVSFAGTTSSIVDMRVFWNSVEQPQCSVQRKLGTGTDVGSASLVGLVDVTVEDQDLEVHVKCNGAADDFDVKEAQLTIVRFAAT